MSRRANYMIKKWKPWKKIKQPSIELFKNIIINFLYSPN